MRGPYCIGLTGGIGCGKSSAARVFERLGAAVVDTDEISRELTRAGGAAIPAICEVFGPESLTAEGALDRARMRALVFRNAAAKQRLEAILHPMIRAESRARIAATRAPYVILVVPLLLETGAYREIVERVLVVDCEEQQQMARTRARSGLSDGEVEAIMAAQLPRAARLAAADDVLRNDADFTTLQRDCEALHRRYLALASGAQSGASAS
ncbi:MAG TPA: dephospho-CoA kinase [Burkholderiales bacterium]|nr:dephospho-CoA kinase [Burkholderiales bacterium]